MKIAPAILMAWHAGWAAAFMALVVWASVGASSVESD
jgi:hypothetical protein